MALKLMRQFGELKQPRVNAHSCVEPAFCLLTTCCSAFGVRGTMEACMLLCLWSSHCSVQRRVVVLMTAGRKGGLQRAWRSSQTGSPSHVFAAAVM